MTTLAERVAAALPCLCTGRFCEPVCAANRREGILALVEAVRREAIEDCAGIAARRVTVIDEQSNDYDRGWFRASMIIRDVIRALLAQEGTPK